MQNNKLENNQHIHQQKPAANSTAAKGTSLPAVSVLQPMSNNKVAQLYSVEDFGKLSAGRQLLLRSNYQLFASGSKIEQANGIGGDVGFEAGKADEHIKDLKEVIAFVRPGSELEGYTKHYDPSEELNELKPNAMKKLPDHDSLTEKYKGLISDFVKYDDELPEEVSSRVKGRDLKLQENRQSLLKEIVEVTLSEIEGIERPALEKRIDDYLQKQVIFQERPFMPSDCRAMASYVAGFDGGSGVDVTHLPVEAGDVYESISPDNRVSEWDFHYATIIMTDGDDHITMENAAAKASDKFDKLKYDHSWVFELFGSKEGQTFDDMYGHLLDPKK